MASLRSEIWKIFDRIDAADAVCTICGKKMKHNGHTSNLIKHARGHNREWCQRRRGRVAPFVAKVDKMDITTENCDITGNTTFEDYENYTETSQSKDLLFQYDPIAIHDRSTALSDRVSSLLNFICHHQLPTHIVEDERFTKFVHSLASDYKLPTGFELQQAITENYKSAVNTYRQKIADARNLSLTLNRWRDRQTNKSYILGTLYYVEDHAPVGRNFVVRELPEKPLADDYQQLLGNIFDQWLLLETQIRCYCINDDDLNMQQALQNMLQNKHALFTPALDNIIVALVGSVLQKECISNAVDILRSVIEFILESKKSQNANDTELEMPQAVADNAVNTPITDHNNVGIATVKMLERFLEIYDKVPDYGSNSPNAALLDVPLIRGLYQLLKPFDCALTELASRDFVELSTLIPMMYCLKAQVTCFSTTLDPLVPIHKMLEVDLNRQCRNVENISQCAVATILDPRFKMLPFRDATASGKALQYLMRTIEDATELLELKPEEAPQTTNDFWRSLNELEKSQGNRQQNEPKDDEISMYLSHPLAARTTSPYKEWQKMRYMFPHLYEQAMMSLTLVAAKEPSKRSFEKACSLYHAFNDNKYGAEKTMSRKLEETLFMSDVNV